ncbi:MAG TPA: ornithine cyclodeaminase family protein [Afifellaceae bacterium]|nr:ornithine cyclodeaminase family protein [Afifellaceae bacterium]
MRIVPASDIADALDFPSLIESLRAAFRSGVVSPPGHRLRIPLPDQTDADLHFAPAWSDFARQGHSERGYVGVGIACVFPGNAERDRAAGSGAYLLMSGRTGEPLAFIDGQALTAWRTAATSALASSYLSRPDASRLLMVGAGSLAPRLIEAHAAVRPIREVLVWNRTGERAERLAKALAAHPFQVSATDDIEGAVRGADIVSCATLAVEPLIKGAWLKPGAHLDLVGSFRPDMREADDACIRRARLFVDDRRATLTDTGDLALPLAAGVIDESDIAADLAELSQGEKAGRRFHDQITLFKSAGTGLADFAAAAHVFARI